jgi:hypothetical protein
LKQLATRRNLPIYHIKCCDEVTDANGNADRAGNLKRNIPKDPDKTAGLVDVLSIAIGSPIMLRHNLNIADGLYNGARGEVVVFEWEGN